MRPDVFNELSDAPRLLLLLALAVAGPASAQPVPSHWKVAPTPPMGWNSWDCFGTTLTEAQARAQADAMAQRLKPLADYVHAHDQINISK